MRKQSSQWEFGELFDQKPEKTATSEKPDQRQESKAPDKKTYGVGELTAEIRRALEGRFRRIRVVGEVSNFRAQSSGHCYFALKDAQAQISCVLFRGERVSHRAELENGAEMVVEGDLSVYEPRGQYQLIVRGLERHGLGALQQAFERLKRKLDTEGLFADERKKPLPPYVFALGVVTSASAAALRDVLQIVRRRHPSLQIVLHPCRVQGQGAAEEVAAGIAALNRFAASPECAVPLDAILVTRGGGSLEDLWAFNEESVARAVAASALPVVSAVGHEIDFTICDFVADLRAPTPSAAAEILTEGVFSSREWVTLIHERLGQLLRRNVEECAQWLGQLDHRTNQAHPQRYLERQRQRVDDLEVMLGKGVRVGREREVWKVQELTGRLKGFEPSAVLAAENERVKTLTRLGAERLRTRFARLAHRLDRLGNTLRLLSPLNVIDRGYSLTREAQSGRLVSSAGSVKPGDTLTTLLKDGEISSVVSETPE